MTVISTAVPVLMFMPLLLGAMSQETTSTFEVSVPEADDIVSEVGLGFLVEGTADLAPSHHLWVFVRRSDFQPLWWPQNAAVIDPEDGRWKIYATVGGGSRDIGWRFDVAVALLAEPAHLKLRASHLKSMQNGEFRPIEMPELIAPPKLFRVMKVSHD